MKEIQLTNGFVAMVDDADFDWLNQWKWYAHKAGKSIYAERTEYKQQKQIRMHVQIMNPENEMRVDHKDLNGLNNQRNNLRICTHAENRRNLTKPKNNTTGFKGVSPIRGKFQATIKVNYQQIYLGVYVDPIDAALAYDKAAKKYFGEFARTNF